MQVNHQRVSRPRIHLRWGVGVPAAIACGHTGSRVGRGHVWVDSICTSHAFVARRVVVILITGVVVVLITPGVVVVLITPGVVVVLITGVIAFTAVSVARVRGFGRVLWDMRGLE